MTDSTQLHLQSCFEEDVKDMFDTADFVIILTQLLVQMAKRGDQKSTRPRTMSRFHSNRPPTISVKRYLQRIFKYAPCSQSCFILCLIYLERASKIDPAFYVCSKSLHRLLITSIMVSTKFYDDGYYKNQHYAQVGGLTLAEMNDLERDFLFRLQFSLSVEPALFCEYKKELGRLIVAFHDATLASLQPTSPAASPQTHRRLLCDPISVSSVGASASASASSGVDETDYPSSSSCSSSYSSTSSLDALLPVPEAQPLGLSLTWGHLYTPPRNSATCVDNLWAFDGTAAPSAGWPAPSSTAYHNHLPLHTPTKDDWPHYSHPYQQQHQQLYPYFTAAPQQKNIWAYSSDSLSGF